MIKKFHHDNSYVHSNKALSLLKTITICFSDPRGFYIKFLS